MGETLRSFGTSFVDHKVPNLILEVFHAVRMFSGRSAVDGYYDFRVHFHEIVDLFGPFQSLSCERANQSLFEYLDSEGRVKRLPAFDRPWLKSYAYMGRLDEESRRKFAMFLYSLMKIDPEERKSTMELLAEPWLDAVVA